MVSFTPLPLYPREIAPGTHWIGGWVCPRAGLDPVEKRKILHCRKSNPGLPAILNQIIKEKKRCLQKDRIRLQLTSLQEEELRYLHTQSMIVREMKSRKLRCTGEVA
jgi:hypothetical protein